MSEFAGTLMQRVRIERPAALRTAGGLQVAGWEEVASCLAEVIPEGVGAEAEGQVLSAMPRFRVTIRTRDGIAVGQRVKWKGRAMLVRQRIDDRGIFTGSSAEQQLRVLALGGGLAEYELSFESGERMLGRFLVSRLEYAGDFNGERNYTLALESSGEVLFC